MQDFRELKVWQKGHALALSVHAATKAFPREELFGLTAQMRRSSASIPTNIAEGCGRGGRLELARFLQMAAGSASELEYQLILARDLGHLEKKRHEELTGEVVQVRRMLAALIQKVRRAAG